MKRLLLIPEPLHLPPNNIILSIIISGVIPFLKGLNHHPQRFILGLLLFEFAFQGNQLIFQFVILIVELVYLQLVLVAELFELLVAGFGAGLMGLLRALQARVFHQQLDVVLAQYLDLDLGFCQLFLQLRLFAF